MREFSPGLFVAQLILVPLFCFIGDGIVADGAIEVTGLSISGYVVCAAIGGILGYAAQRTDPRIADSFGQWIWISPVLICVWGVTDEIQAGRSVACYFQNCTGSSHPGPELVFFTFPAVSCCFYAAGITRALKRQKIESNAGTPIP